MTTLESGFYLSTYLAPAETSTWLGIEPRHDQNATLWHLEGERLELVRHWELERFSGEKQHSSVERSTSIARQRLIGLLRRVAVEWSDLKACWGTPGLDFGAPYRSPDDRFAIHSMAHLYSVLISSTQRLRHENILAFGLDGGPDHILGRREFQYVGAVSKAGTLEYFPSESPGRLFNSATHLYGMEAGSLMALASACRESVEVDIDALLGESRFDISRAGSERDVVTTADRVVHEVVRTVTSGMARRGDHRFTSRERTASAVMKVIQQLACRIMERNIEEAIRRYGLEPATTSLALAGGFALHCPTNSWLMSRYAFKEFVGSPCSNDSGQALGVGLMVFHSFLGQRLQFELPGPYLGEPITDIEAALREFAEHIDLVEPTTRHFVDDVIRAPVVWAEGRSEVGPRALCHRSVLCDPRTAEAREQVNAMKRRQWWRPVSPVALDRASNDFFEAAFPSPFMLHTFGVRPERRAEIPAVVHLDDSARCQTIDAEHGPLYGLIEDFEARTGVAMLGNTSLNDQGEPIAQSAADVLRFCIRRGVSVAYIDGTRILLQGGRTEDEPLEPRVDWATGNDACGHDTTSSAPRPTGLSTTELYYFATHPSLQAGVNLATEDGEAMVRELAGAHYEANPNDHEWVRAFVQRKSSGAAGHVNPYRPTSLGTMASTRIVTDADAAAAILLLRDDGYLHLPNLVPDGQLTHVREPVLHRLVDWGIVDGRRLSATRPKWTGAHVPYMDRRALEAIVSCSAFARTLHDGACAPITDLARRLLGSSARIAARVHLYCALPDREEFCSPPHQDTYGLANSESLRLWIALTESRLGDAGLAIAPRSHRAARRHARPNTNYRVRPLGGHAARSSERTPLALEWSDGSEWCSAAFHPGDVVVMHPDIVHASLPATTDQVRVSLAIDIATGRLDAHSEAEWLPEPVRSDLAGGRGPQ